jgi:hypothetical protein
MSIDSLRIIISNASPMDRNAYVAAVVKAIEHNPEREEKSLADVVEATVLDGTQHRICVRHITTIAAMVRNYLMRDLFEGKTDIGAEESRLILSFFETYPLALEERLRACERTAGEHQSMTDLAALGELKSTLRRMTACIGAMRHLHALILRQENPNSIDDEEQEAA